MNVGGFMKEKVFNFWELNKQKLVIVLILYCVSITSIGLVNYPYIDDIARRIEGVGNFAEHYSRYLSEYASYIVQGSHHLTDTGLTTFIVSAVILTLASCVILYVIYDGERVTWLSALGSVVIGVNPWFLEPLSFRFDGPYIALSVLVSVIPFIFLKSKSRYLFLISIFGVFLMCNSYQGSSGIYPVFLMTLLLGDIVNKKKINGIVKKISVATSAYVLAIGLYFIETRFNSNLSLRGDTTKIASLSEMPTAIVKNLSVYFSTLRSQLTNSWLYLFYILVILIIFYVVYNSKINKIVTLFLTIIYLYLGAIFSFGIYMFFSTPLASIRPRYEYGFAFFVGLLLVSLGQYISHTLLDYIKGIVIVLITYYSISFAFTYASALDIQKETFENESILLSEDLNKYVTIENQNVYISGFFRDSPVYLNTSKTYPILKDLVPSNTSLYWPNLLWFKTISNLNVNLVGFDFNTIDINNLEKLESNKLWDIYKLHGDIYVYTK